jgi:hypothetical protein
MPDSFIPHKQRYDPPTIPRKSSFLTAPAAPREILMMASTKKWYRISAFLLSCALPSASSFLSVGRRSVKILLPTSLASLTYDDTGTGVVFNNALDGVADFEEWFSSNMSSGARVNSIRHSFFNSMGRGLQFTSAKSSDLNKVAVVPRKLVMRVPCPDEDDKVSSRSWDTNLSCKLWEECQKGKDSVYYG